jgi:hypothetical protein
MLTKSRNLTFAIPLCMIRISNRLIYVLFILFYFVLFEFNIKSFHHNKSTVIIQNMCSFNNTHHKITLLFFITRVLM